jgi:hypothetical protein
MAENDPAGDDFPIIAMMKQLEIEERTFKALCKNSIQPNVLQSQQKRIDYLKKQISKGKDQKNRAVDEPEKIEYILDNSELSTEKIDWKIKILEKKAFIELQYVEAAARLDMAYGDLKQEEVISSLMEAKERYSVLEKALQKWKSLKPEKESDEQPYLNESSDSHNDERSVYGKIDISYECKESDYIIRFLSDHENAIHVGRQRGKFSFKGDGIMELEIHFLHPKTKIIQAMGFFPLNLFLSSTKEFLKLEMEPEGIINIQVKIKVKPKDWIERKPAIIRKAIKGHQMEETHVLQLRKCTVCNELCFSRREGSSCRECRIFSHKKCTITTTCNLISMHQRSGSSGQNHELVYEKRHTLQSVKILFPTWCGHCGLVIPFGKKSASKCNDCGRIWHIECCNFIPNTCGVVKLLSKLEKQNINLLDSGKPNYSDIDRYKPISCLGRGNFGKVLLMSVKNNSNEVYAVKILKKKRIFDNEEFENVKTEQRILELATRGRHPYLVHLKECFQDSDCVYFVLEYASGGDMLFHVQSEKEVSEQDQRY